MEPRYASLESILNTLQHFTAFLQKSLAILSVQFDATRHIGKMNLGELHALLEDYEHLSSRISEAEDLDSSDKQIKQLPCLAQAPGLRNC